MHGKTARIGMIRSRPGPWPPPRDVTVPGNGRAATLGACGGDAMVLLLPVAGTGLVGGAVGALWALLYERPLLWGARWGALGGLAFGAVAVALLALAP